jgi:DNA mismatch repair protein MutS
LDEVGRGTSTYDGLSIAWGLVEHFIEETKALTLFATHYHELIDIAEKNPTAKNLTVETVNHKGNVQFLYRLIEKPASQSFGIYVANLAGLPKSVILRSEEILHQLETNHTPVVLDQKSSLTKHPSSQLCFLEDLKTEEIPTYLKVLEEEISKLDVMKMTPIDALLKLNQLKLQLELH